MSDKTEKPTPKRRRKAREDGRIARSRIFSGGGALALGTIAATVTAPASAAGLKAWTESLWSDSGTRPGIALAQGTVLLIRAAAPIAFAALAGGTLATLATSGVQLNAKALQFKWERLNFAMGFSQLFSAQRWIDALKGLAIFGILATIAYASFKGHLALFLRGLSVSRAETAVLERSVSSSAVRLLFALCAIGGLDLLWARKRHQSELMMSREEVKREHKESEGDPRHKHHRRALHRQLAQGGPARGVKAANAIVVNPTHIAVALRYDEGESEAPYLVAKGREQDAFAIRAEATRLGIPIVKDIPLARSLIHYDVGDEVPEELYRAAAAVLKVAMEIRDGDERPGSETP